MRPDLPAAVPEIPVTDLAFAMAYYQQQLGFTLDWHEESLGLAGLSSGNCRIFLASSQFRTSYGNAGPALTWLNLDSKGEVDSLHQVWSANGARVLSEPESKPWGLHEFTATDPDGNLFRVFYDFATPERTPPCEPDSTAAAIAVADAIGRRDVAALRELLAPEFCHRTTAGVVTHIDAFLEGIAAIPGTIESVRLEHLQSDLLGDTALVTGTQSARVVLNGEVIDDRRGFVDCFVREGGRWRLRVAYEA
jgi:uncharacterized glyoxalase superfamily protein PhnB